MVHYAMESHCVAVNSTDGGRRREEKHSSNSLNVQFTYKHGYLS